MSRGQKAKATLLERYGSDYFTHLGRKGRAQQKQEDTLKGARNGGRKVSEDRAHMAEMGRKGGTRTSQDREHMAELGRRSAAKRREKNASSS